MASSFSWDLAFDLRRLPYRTGTFNPFFLFVTVAGTAFRPVHVVPRAAGSGGAWGTGEGGPVIDAARTDGGAGASDTEAKATDSE